MTRALLWLEWRRWGRLTALSVLGLTMCQPLAHYGFRAWEQLQGRGTPPAGDVWLPPFFFVLLLFMAGFSLGMGAFFEKKPEFSELLRSLPVSRQRLFGLRAVLAGLATPLYAAAFLGGSWIVAWQTGASLTPWSGSGSPFGAMASRPLLLGCVVVVSIAAGVFVGSFERRESAFMLLPFIAMGLVFLMEKRLFLPAFPDAEIVCALLAATFFFAAWRAFVPGEAGSRGAGRRIVPVFVWGLLVTLGAGVLLRLVRGAATMLSGGIS